MAKAPKPKRPDARPHVRFPAMLRVDYPGPGGRPAFAYTSHVSAGDLLLRAGLKEGEPLELTVSLGTREQALALKGTVRGPEGDGTVLVVLDPDQEEALQQLRAFIEKQYVKKLEEAVARSPRAADKALELAGYYVEVERGSDAVEVLRKTAQTSPQNLAVAELLGEQLFLLLATDPGQAPLLAELEALVEQARPLGKSDVLSRVAAHLADLRQQAQRRRNE
ncbi:MAG TPA: PilZ domain-containing protein, partial [Myxococcales bacterium]|nr:PilZ domain-containing protein [Myxococcales bacterium]